jgi:hypothetical protein
MMRRNKRDATVGDDILFKRLEVATKAAENFVENGGDPGSPDGFDLDMEVLQTFAGVFRKFGSPNPDKIELN